MDADSQARLVAEIEAMAPPDIDESEMAICAFLLVGASTSELSVALDVDDFSALPCRAVWNATKELERRGITHDFDMVLQQVRDAGEEASFRLFGGVERFLRECCNRLVTVATLPFHARRLAGKGDLRRFRLALTRLLARMGDTEIAPEDLIAEAESLVLAMPNRQRSTAIEPLKQVARRVFGELEQRVGKPQRRGVSSGFADLDTLTGGFQAKDLVVLAARPAMGKTAFAVQTASAVAEHEAALVLEFEMDSTALVKRLMAGAASMPHEELTGGHQINGAMLANLHRRLGTTLDRRLSFVSKAAMKLSEVKSIARRWRVQNSRAKGLIVVDYLQLVRPDRQSREPNEARDVGEVSQGLKALAVELDCTVLALAQLNRDLERRQDKRPVMADLRSSGQIEQDADLIAFLYRDEVYNPSSDDRGTAEVIVAKNRNGKTGAIKLAWKPTYTRFEALP